MSSDLTAIGDAIVLAAELGVTTGSFYWHFRGRDDFVASLVDYWGREFTARVIEDLAYDEWRHDFYEGVPRARWLSHCAERFDALEINATHYRLQQRSTFERWASAKCPALRRANAMIEPCGFTPGESGNMLASFR